MQYRSIAGQLSLLALARQLTLLALAQLARQLKSLDFPHAIPANNVASANSSADIADARRLARLARLARQLKPLALPPCKVDTNLRTSNLRNFSHAKPPN